MPDVYRGRPTFTPDAHKDFSSLLVFNIASHTPVAIEIKWQPRNSNGNKGVTECIAGYDGRQVIQRCLEWKVEEDGFGEHLDVAFNESDSSRAANDYGFVGC